MFDIIEVPDLQWLRSTSLAGAKSKDTGDSLLHGKNDLSDRAQNRAAHIRSIINSMLEGCRIQCAIEPYNQAFHSRCIEECVKKGYPVTKNLEAGVFMSPSYLHLPSQETQIWIALFTGFVVCIDGMDDSSYYPDLELFSERLIKGQKQGNVLLESFANVLKEIPLHFRGLQAQVVLTSSINFISGCLIEHRTSGRSHLRNSNRFVEFYRILSGIAEAYSMFIFPPETPFEDYIQAVPEIYIMVNNTNDVMSFYKEELKGETVNYVSLQAESRGQSKMDILQQVANDVATCHRRIVNLLSNSSTMGVGNTAKATTPSALTAYQAWATGNANFHVSYVRRYRMNELGW